jgi:RNA polymerase sigma-70 factor (ECF subfamily)
MTDINISREMWDRLVRQIGIRIRGRFDAEDLLHAAYLRLEDYRKSHLVENVNAFLVKTAVNIGVDTYRRERLTAKMKTERALLGENGPLQDEVLAVRNRLVRVKEGLAQLHPRTRQILLMHRLQKMKYKEIALQIGISQSAVEKHVAKGTLFLVKWSEGW